MEVVDTTPIRVETITHPGSITVTLSIPEARMLLALVGNCNGTTPGDGLYAGLSSALYEAGVRTQPADKDYNAVRKALHSGMHDCIDFATHPYTFDGPV